MCRKTGLSHKSTCTPLASRTMSACESCLKTKYHDPECPLAPCYKCHTAGHTANACPSVKSAPRRSGPYCKNCRKQGHLFSECREPTVHCERCGMKYHKKDECRTDMGVHCTRCSMYGHGQKQCTTSQCTRCTQFGHEVALCRVPEGMAYCSVCLRIHTTAYCLEQVYCGLCNKKGHFAAGCTTPRCATCSKYGHTEHECYCVFCEVRGHVVDWCAVLKTTECKFCSELGHSIKMCKRLAEHECGNCGKKGHMTRHCKEPGQGVKPAHDSTQPVLKCDKCKRLGHHADECKTRPCIFCGSFEHNKAGCDTLRKRSCRKCGIHGHFEKNCPAPVCYRCKGVGHRGGDCPGEEFKKDGEPLFVCSICGSNKHYSHFCDVASTKR